MDRNAWPTSNRNARPTSSESADWPGYLTATVTEFVLSRSDPPGSVDPDTAAWLVTALASARHKSAAAIVRTIFREAKHVDEALLAFGGRGTKRPALEAE